MTRPRIALTVSGTPTTANLAARERYVKALSAAGADVVVVEPGQKIPAGIAGICFSGGGDIAPERYGEIDADKVCENVIPERDELELDAAKRALDADIPILGICRGFQVLNVALGGRLAQDIKGHQASGDQIVEHRLSARDGSKLAQATSSRELRVNSRHHQAVTPDRLAPALVPTVLHDGLVEAFESPTHRWVVGVQWHPERTSEVDADAARIFDAFVAEASRKATVATAS
ncbi:MAG TPA: gamma-glutamyl-gamma-aminobutyrate hydrolase family protein [Candidatus Limnocylindrales bacterium]|nr:gamma-glutamyl-gamma-aminobutyrate hydrolase family protein [Candidatus Limnocylindrales bacterium]